MLKRMQKKKMVITGMGILVLIALATGFLYLQRSRVVTTNSQSRIVYRVMHFDAQGESTRNDYRSINIDGTDDKLIYSATERYNSLSVFNHRDIGIGTSTATIFFDKNGKDISGVYKPIDGDISIEEYNAPAYSIDGNMVAVIGHRTQNDLPEISVLNTQTEQVKRYLCKECKNYQEYHASGFSRGGKGLYFYVVRDRPNHPLDTDPDLRYLYIDLTSGDIVDMNIPYSSGEYYKLYPQYDLAFKIKGSTYYKAGSVDLVMLKDMSQKRLVDDIGDGVVAFNGKDIAYDTFIDRSAFGGYYPLNQEIRGVNINSGERYHILPPNLVNTAKTGRKIVRDFLPNSATFIYTAEHDSGWEVRIHGIDTGEDRSILNLSAERFNDKTSFIKEYIGVIF